MAFTLRLRGGKSNYPYAVARVQAKRAKLIPPRDYEKILKMDVSEITRFIEDSAYKAEVDELGARFSGLDLLEAALTVNEERTYASVRRMLEGPGGALIELFLARHLVNDLKTLFRGKNAGASREDLLKELLLEDLDTYGMFQPLLSEDVRTFDDIVQALLRQSGVAADWGRILSRVPEGSGLNVYEDVLDKAYYGRLLDSLVTSRQKGSDQFLKFTRHEIDARNLVNAARWVTAGQGGDFTPYIIPGGLRFKVGDVVALARAPDMDAFAEALQDSEVLEGIRDGLAQTRATGRLVPLETAVRRRLMDELGRLSHQHPLSIVPILLFLIQKDREVRVLRAVARGKAAGLSEERLRELVTV